MKKINAQYLISVVAMLIWHTVHFGWAWLAASYLYYRIVVGLLGNQIAQHRYFSHRSFQTSAAKEWLLYCASLTTGVNPLFYALAHRHYHRYSERSCEQQRCG